VALTGGIAYVATSFDTNSATSRPDSDTTAYVVNGAVNYRQERYSLSATLARNIRPTGNGDLNIFDQVNMTYRYQLSDLSGFNASLLGGNTEALEGAIDNDRRFAQIGLGISYKLAASWSVSGDYTYRYQDNGSGSAQSNAVEIRLTFNPKEYIWSR
jgi:predicted porin